MDTLSKGEDDEPGSMDVDIRPTDSLGEKVRQLCGEYYSTSSIQ